MMMTQVDDYDAHHEAKRIAACHAKRKAFTTYNRTFHMEQVTRGEQVSKDQLAIPWIDCLVAGYFSGYGDGSAHTYIVRAKGYVKKTRQMKSLLVVRVYGLDVGIGDADAMPERPGLAAFDPDEEPTELTVRWERGEVCWGEYNKKMKHWERSSWQVGAYVRLQ